MDPGTGERRWVFDAAPDSGATSYHAEVLVHEGLVLVSTDGAAAHLYALDALTGELRWKVFTDDGINTDPLVYQDLVIGVRRRDQESTLVAFELATGETRWESPIEAAAESPVIINCSPVLIGDRVFHAGSTNVLHVFDLRTGVLIESHEIGAFATTSLVRDRDRFVFGTDARLFQADGLLITGTREGMVIAVRPGDGTRAWILELEGTIRTFAAVGDRYVIGTVEGHVMGLDAVAIRAAEGD